MMSMASIGSVTAVLVILGYIMLLILNINNAALKAQEEFDEIAVFIIDEANDTEIEQLGKDISKIKGVLSVVYKSREQALEEQKLQWKEDSYLLDDLRRNPFPNSYIIQLEDVKFSDYVIQEINKSGYVENVRYHMEAAKSLMSIANTLKKLGIFIIGILILISIFIISNTVKMTVVHRRKEIELMQYIGASNGYVRGPFIIEGVVLGIVGSAVATAIIAFSYNYLTNYLTGYFSLLSGFSGYLMQLNIILKDVAIIFVTIGVGIGTLGSLISLKKFLNA
jgi:cell division transport system permease protein